MFTQFLLSKGLVGLAGDLPGTIGDFGRAFMQVVNRGPDYIKSLRTGSSHQYGEASTRGFLQYFIRSLEADTKARPTEWAGIAKEYGLDAKEFVAGLYRVMHNGMWAFGDMLKLTQEYGLQRRGLSHAEAIKQAEKMIVNYQPATHIIVDNAAGQVMAKVLMDRRLTIFNRWHYGLMRGAAITMRDIVKGTPQERRMALDTVAMGTALVGFSTLANQAARDALGNSNAQVKQRGALAIYENIQNVLDHKKDPRDFLLSIMTPGPLTTLPVELLYGIDPYTGQTLVRGRDITEHPARWAKEVMSMLGSQIYPISDALRVAKGKETAQAAILKQLGIGEPSPEGQTWRDIGDIKTQIGLTRQYGE